MRSSFQVYPSFESQNDKRAFLEELRFWGLTAMPSAPSQERHLASYLPKELIQHLNSEPTATGEVLSTWRFLGPIKLSDIFKFATAENPVRQEVPFGNLQSSIKYEVSG